MFVNIESYFCLNCITMYTYIPSTLPPLFSPSVEKCSPRIVYRKDFSFILLLASNAPSTYASISVKRRNRKKYLIFYANLMSCFSRHPSKSLRFSLKHNFLHCKQQLQIDLSYHDDLVACLL